MLQYRFRMEKLLDVPPESFRPAPKVDSAIVRMLPLPISEIAVRNEKLFAAIVRMAFGQRRKTLRNTLRGYLHEADFERLVINPQLRAENLAVADFIKVANYLDEGSE
jgi:16S rRNA (adenine1518-N6/adenine1519-N6)-dimethyltransferase